MTVRRTQGVDIGGGNDGEVLVAIGEPRNEIAVVIDEMRIINEYEMTTLDLRDSTETQITDAGDVSVGGPLPCSCNRLKCIRSSTASRSKYEHVFALSNIEYSRRQRFIVNADDEFDASVGRSPAQHRWRDERRENVNCGWRHCA